MTLDPAGYSRTFVLPSMVRWLSVLGIVGCTAACMGLLWLVLLQTNGGNRLLGIVALAGFGSLLYVSIVIALSSGDSVVVTNDGLSRRSRKGRSLFIPWKEIASVDTQNVLQRLVVTDLTRGRRIHLEYHLEDFGELRRTVQERTGIGSHESSQPPALDGFLEHLHGEVGRSR